MLLLAIAFFVLLVINSPLAFTIGISSLLFFINNPDLPLTIPVTLMVNSTQSFPLLAVPFFVLAGNLMNECGITIRLMRFANVLTGHLKGGLAHVNIVLSALMGGISGSACSDAAMDCKMTAPMMIRQGYSKGFTAAVTGLSSLITATIPPGIGLILFGYVGEVSIGKLFIGGVVPGILMTFLMMGGVTIMSHIRGYKPARETRATFNEFIVSFFDNIWALMFPVLLILGIRFGVFTPSEAGAFAVVYAFIVGKFIYKELSWKQLLKVLRQTAEDNGMIMLIIICSSIFGYVTVYEQAPQGIAAFLTSLTTNPTGLFFIILGFLFIAGMFMESTVNTLLLTPIFLPIMKAAGVDPVHFGLVMMTMITLGSMTPPVGVVIYTVCSLLDCPVEEYVIESLPFILSVIILEILLVFFPQLVLFLPNLVYGG